MGIWDVTERLRVDTDRADPDSLELAVALIEAGMSAVVGSDEAAVSVLERLGLSRAEADDQVRAAHGPMAVRAD